MYWDKLGDCFDNDNKFIRSLVKKTNKQTNEYTIKQQLKLTHSNMGSISLFGFDGRILVMIV